MLTHLHSKCSEINFFPKIDRSTKKTPQKTKETLNHKLTPRKQAKFMSPKGKKLFRKKTTNPQTWKKNIHKQNRQSCQEYTSVSGKIVPAKTIEKNTCGDCRLFY